MARVCVVTNKKPLSGNRVSHANNKTRRRWLPNLQVCSFPSEILESSIRLRLTANGIRTIEHKGGVDSWLLNATLSSLDPQARRWRKRLEDAQNRKATSSSSVSN